MLKPWAAGVPARTPVARSVWRAEPHAPPELLAQRARPDVRAEASALKLQTELRKSAGAGQRERAPEEQRQASAER